MEVLPAIKHKTYIKSLIGEVYKILTTADGWDKWFTNGTTVDLQPGGYIHFKWQDFGPDRVEAEDRASIEEVIPNQKLTFLWSPGGNPTTVTIDLTTKGEGTLVEVTETGHKLEEKSMLALMTCAVGWGEALTLLKFYLEHGVTYGTVPQ